MLDFVRAMLTSCFTSPPLKSRSTAAAIAAERVARGKRDAHHASSRLSRSGLIVTEITTAAAPRRLPTVARVVLVARAMGASMLMPSYTYMNAAINSNIDKYKWDLPMSLMGLCALLPTPADLHSPREARCQQGQDRRS